MIAVKISVTAILLTAVIVIIRQYQGDFAFAVQVAAVIILVALSLNLTDDIFKELISITSNSEINNSYIKLLIKAVGAAVIIELSADMCRDTGNSALAFSVELTGKIIILSMSFPMLKALCEFITGILK